MKRTQLQLDETTYEAVRAAAFTRGTSMAAVIRESLQQYFADDATAGWTLDDLSFVGAGRSAGTGPLPVSERHDEALAEDFAH